MLSMAVLMIGMSAANPKENPAELAAGLMPDWKFPGVRKACRPLMWPATRSSFAALTSS